MNTLQRFKKKETLENQFSNVCYKYLKKGDSLFKGKELFEERLHKFGLELTDMSDEEFKFRYDILRNTLKLFRDDLKN